MFSTVYSKTDITSECWRFHLILESLQKFFAFDFCFCFGGKYDLSSKHIDFGSIDILI